MIRKLYRDFKRLFFYIFYRNEVLTEEFDEVYLHTKWPDRTPEMIVDRDESWFVPERQVDFSLVVPVYNVVQYLPRLLENIAGQHKRYRYEVILVDDGSTDGSADICDGFSQKYPNLFRVEHQQNAGISAARNAGIAHSSGKYIGFIDSDDNISTEYVEKIMDAAYKNDADIVKTAYETRNENEKVLFCYNKRVAVSRRDTNRVDNIQSMNYVWGGCYRRTLFHSFQFPVGWWFEDVINAFFFFEADCVVNIEDVLYTYYIRGASISHQLWCAGDYKALEDLYLRRHCVDAMLELYPKDDCYLFKLIIIQMDAGGYRPYTDGLDEKTQRQLFLGIRDLVLKHYREEYLAMLSAREREITNAIVKSQYKLWRHLHWN